MSSVSAESHVEQARIGCVSVFRAAGAIPAFWSPVLADVVVHARY